jgi:hypothetical protein
VGKPPVDDPDERHGRGGKISPSRRAPYAACEYVGQGPEEYAFRDRAMVCWAVPDSGVG